MDLSRLFQILDFYSPTPIDTTYILLYALIIYGLPVIIVIVIIAVVSKHKKKNQTIQIGSQPVQSEQPDKAEEQINQGEEEPDQTEEQSNQDENIVDKDV